MKLVLMIFVSLNSLHATASEHIFQKLKNKINLLENQIIQDFELGGTEREVGPKEYHQTAKIIESQYKKQLQIFSQIHEQLMQVESRISKSFDKGQLTKAEMERLKNNIEYADRIILRSRKEEVGKIYHQLKSKLSHIPRLEEVYTKLQSAAETNKCTIKNLFFDKLAGVLSFDVLSTDNPTEESGKTINFTITQGDVAQGLLNSEVMHGGAFRKFVTQYQSAFPSSEGLYSFTLTENTSGEIAKASFHQTDIVKPYMQLFGVSFGSEKVDRSYYCGSGPQPASVR